MGSNWDGRRAWAMAARSAAIVPVFEYAAEPHQAVHHGRRGGSQRAGGGTGHPHTGDRLHPQEARRDRRHGRGAVPLLHVVQPAQRRTGRRTQQGAGRRPARPRRRTAANRGKNSSKRTPTANSNVDPVPPRRPSRTVSRPRIRLSQPTRFQAVVRPLHPLSERFSRRSAILITFRNFQTKFSYELQFYRINSNHCVTNLKKLKKNS